ncbi:MAG: ABC transporter permease [Coriobacteriales bacterium]|nr:ABC transporter permease [Coriobacteriales bacterium]
MAGSRHTRRSFYLKMVLTSLLRRRSRMVVALLSVMIGATILSGLVTVYYDIPRQMGQEFRSYGANLVLLPSNGGSSINPEDFEKAKALLPAGETIGITPFCYENVLINGQPYIAAGTEFAQAQTTSPYWLIEGAWPQAPGEILVGREIAETILLKPGDPLTIEANDYQVVGIVTSGSQEDAFVFLSLEDFYELYPERLFAASPDGETDGLPQGETDGLSSIVLPPGHTSESDCASCHTEEFINTALSSSGTTTTAGLDLVECSVSVSTDELDALVATIAEDVPGIAPRLVKRVTQSEDTVLAKLQSLVYLVTLVILVLTMICVATTMMAVVSERRREIGLRKALGASNLSIIMEFMGESLVLGVIGGLGGVGLGFLFAQAVSANVFSRTIEFQPLMIPFTLVVSVLVTGLACLLPVRGTTQIDPAIVLKGE